MLKKSMFLSLALASASSFAKSNVDFSLLTDPQPPMPPPSHQNPMHECMKQAWQAAGTSEEQNQAARDLMVSAHTAIEPYKAAIQAAFGQMHTAWSQYPISKIQVVAAESALDSATTPVKGIVRDTHIDILNLLSADQRTAFDDSFKTCIHP